MKPVKFLNSFILFVSILCLSQNLFGQNQNQKEHYSDFFLGEWDIELFNKNGQVVGLARTEGRHILDNKALQSDYYAINKEGKSIFRGTTIRTYIPTEEIWVVHWAMANIKGFTYLEEKVIEEELHAEGHGVDPGGKFQEEYKYFDITPISYSFEMKRSYDNGETWEYYTILKAKRRDRRRK